MATVNFIPYRSQSRAALNKVAEYLRRRDKTAEQKFVSAQSCSPQLAAEEFAVTRALHGKESPVWFYHYTQSFSPGEAVTPEQAHRLAREFASRAWPDSEVLIVTHVDAPHIHSHFLVNAVCHESGKMLRQGPRTLEYLRALSDELCLQYGLSVLGWTRKQPTGVGNREYRAAEKGQSWKFELMNVIDECMRCARSRREFIRRMRERGYEVRWTAERKNITYTTPTGMRCRDNKLHEEKYLKEAMERELRIREEIIYGRTEGPQPAAPAFASSDAGPVPDAGGMGNPDRANRGSGLPNRGDLCGASPAAVTGDAGAGGEAGGGGSSADRDMPTGWEEERAALLALQAPEHLAAVAAGHPGADRVGGSLVRDALRLGRDLERLQYVVPVNDASTRQQRGDRKQLRREQEKKIALGHKEDDHEEQQGQQQMG